MTAATLKKLRTITYDAQGKPASVLINLKNKMMREAYFKAVEEIEAKEVFRKIEATKNDPTNTWSDFFEVAKSILADKKKVHL